MAVFALVLTIGAYALALRIRRVPAVLTAGVVLAIAMPALRIDRHAYETGTAILVALLGPAIVALALPLVRARRAILASLAPSLAAIVAGSIAAIVTAIAVGRSVHLPDALIAAIAPRAATSPVAAAIAQHLHADPHIAVVASVVGGMAGAVLAPVVFRFAGTPVRAGLALGVAAHAIGTAEANRRDGDAGAAATAAMALNALATALLAPIIVPLLLR